MLKADLARQYMEEYLKEVPNGVLTGDRLVDLIKLGMITDIGSLHQVNASSVDLRCSGRFFIEDAKAKHHTVTFSDTTPRAPKMVGKSPLVDLDPGAWCLGSSIEKFNIPESISGFVHLRSTAGRSGMDHAASGFIDPGFHDSNLTFEFQNVNQYHPMRIELGNIVAQVIFFKGEVVSPRYSYRNKGRYNNSKGTVEAIVSNPFN